MASSEAPIPIPSRPGEHRAPCPYCAKRKRDDALAIRVEPDGSAVWYCHRCGERGGTRGNATDKRPPDIAARRAQAEAVRQADEKRKIAAALRIWHASGPIGFSPAQAYLLARGIDPDAIPTQSGMRWPETLRWCADADGYGNGALVVAVNDGHSGLVRAVQRIFVNADGTAQRDDKGKRKRARGPLKGNAARLSCPIHSEGWWAIAEGVETALAARQITGVPTWAAISAGNMAAVKPPHWARHAVIFADNDANGVGLTEAAKALHGLRQMPEIETARVLSTDALNTDVADLIKETANG